MQRMDKPVNEQVRHRLPEIETNVGRARVTLLKEKRVGRSQVVAPMPLKFLWKISGLVGTVSFQTIGIDGLQISAWHSGSKAA